MKDKAYFFAREPDAAIPAVWNANAERAYGEFRATVKATHGVRTSASSLSGAQLSAASRMAEFLMSAEFRALARAEVVLSEHPSHDRDLTWLTSRASSPMRSSSIPATPSVGRVSDAEASLVDTHELNRGETDFLALQVWRGTRLPAPCRRLAGALRQTKSHPHTFMCMHVHMHMYTMMSLSPCVCVYVCLSMCACVYACA